MRKQEGRETEAEVISKGKYTKFVGKTKWKRKGGERELKSEREAKERRKGNERDAKGRQKGTAKEAKGKRKGGW